MLGANFPRSVFRSSLFREHILADVANITLLGGNHRVTAYLQLLAEHNDDADEVAQRYSVELLRPLVFIYASKRVDSKTGDMIKLSSYDIRRLAGDDNRIPRGKPKTYFDLVRSFKQIALEIAGLPVSDLSQTLPSWWTRDKHSDKAFLQFLRFESPSGVTPAVSSVICAFGGRLGGLIHRGPKNDQTPQRPKFCIFFRKLLQFLDSFRLF